MHKRIRNGKAAALVMSSIISLGAMISAPLLAQEDAPGIAMENCELLVPGTSLSAAGQCGFMQRPENPADPEGRQIDIHVARIPARGRVAEPDPLVFFAGGPGQSATETWPMLGAALRNLGENRDVLLVDQRGTGQSNPLKCPEMSFEEMLATDDSEIGRITSECLDAIDGDPRFYTTSIAMADIDAAREAMGYETVNLFGVSYGTRAAQVYLRLYPERVRSMVLDSVVPQTLILGSEHAMKLDKALRKVLQGCQNDTDCRQAFPNTEQNLNALIRYVQENPPEVTIDHPNTGAPVTLEFTRDMLASSLRFLTYQADYQAMLPLLIHEAATTGRFDRLASQMLIATAGLTQSIARGMEMSVMCAEDYPWFPEPSPESEKFLMGNVMHEVVKGQCEVWPSGTVPDNFHDPVKSDVPTLLMSGEYDPVTPPEYADEVMAYLENSTHLVAPGQGHSVTGRGCMGKLMIEFIETAGAEELDSECLSDMQPSPFFLSLLGPKP